MTYTVDAIRSGRWWALQCVEVPGALGQSLSLEEAERIMPEAIAFVSGVPEADIDVIVVPHVSEAVREHMRAADRLRKESARANSEAARQSRLAARSLRDSGLTVRDTGRVLGVSHQRAAQLLKT